MRNARMPDDNIAHTLNTINTAKPAECRAFRQQMETLHRHRLAQIHACIEYLQKQGDGAIVAKEVSTHGMRRSPLP